MAIALRGVSAALTNPGSAAAIIPAVHASAAAGDLSILFLGGKPFNTTGMAFTGWVPLTGILQSGSVANGTDAGSVFVAAWVKESASPGAVPAPTMTNFNTAQATIITFSKAATEVWDYNTWTTSNDTSAGSNYSATGSAIPTASGDMIVSGTAYNTDFAVTATTLGGLSGSTIGTQVTDQSATNTTGNDCGLVTHHAPITAGSSAAAPTMAATVSTSTTVLAESIIIRLRVGQLTIPGPINMNEALSRASNW